VLLFISVLSGREGGRSNSLLSLYLSAQSAQLSLEAFDKSLETESASKSLLNNLDRNGPVVLVVCSIHS
jgi:hypothetical protein